VRADNIALGRGGIAIGPDQLFLVLDGSHRRADDERRVKERGRGPGR
jgi:hypothetical protein